MSNDLNIGYLYNYVKRRINMADFLETEIECSLNWLQVDTSARCICPMPDHKDGKPSFQIDFKEEDEIWLYYCFGCGASGTIIDFCQKYYELDSPAEAVLMICQKMGFKENSDVIIDCLKDVHKRVDLTKKIECSNIIVSNQCRVLLERDYENNHKWVGQAYRRLNKALDVDDFAAVEKIGYEAHERMG